jgi:hypothetical protein
MVEFDTWDFLIQEEVTRSGARDSIMIRLPERVKKLVGEEKLTDTGPVVHWNVEREHKYLVLSNSGLRKNQYEAVKQTQIYDIDNLDQEGGRIRPPQGIINAWAGSPESGDRVYYLSHRQMINGEVQSVYLLTEDQILDLLPRNRNHAGSTIDSVFEVPGFNQDT